MDTYLGIAPLYLLYDSRHAKSSLLGGCYEILINCVAY